MVDGNSEDVSSRRPIEQRSSSVVQTDSRYRGRMDNMSREFYVRQNRDRFAPAIINTFKIDTDFRFPNDYLLSGSSKVLQTDQQKELNISKTLNTNSLKFSIVRSEKPEMPDDKYSRRNRNDRFSKLYSTSVTKLASIPDKKLKRPDKRQDEQNSANNLVFFNSRIRPLKNSSRDVVTAKNRVVIKSGSHKIPLRYDTPNFHPVSLATATNDNEMKYELKNWPDEAIQDVQDLLNYEKYISSIEGNSDQLSGGSYGDAPIYDGFKKKKKKKKPVRLSSSHHKEPPVTPAFVGPVTTYNRQPLMQPNVQEIIQWLQIPAFTSGQNLSHIVQDILPGEPVRNVFDQTYQGSDLNRPLTTSESYSNENSYPHVPHTYIDDEVSFVDHKTPQNYIDKIYDVELPNRYPQLQTPVNTFPYIDPQSTFATTSHIEEVVSISPQVPQFHHLDNPHQQLDNPNPQDLFQSSGQFDNQPLEHNYPSITDITDIPQSPLALDKPNQSVDIVSIPTSVVTLLTDLANKKPQSRPIFRPSSEITQNTVVHILNTGSRKPNVTVSEMNVPQVVKPTNTSGTGTPPNVHIMFMTDETESSEKPPVDSFSMLQDTSCPTILINSITRVNNTIESKEGCTDLNIVINSQVLSTNVFKPGNVEGDDAALQDKYSGSSELSQDDSNANTQDPYSGSTSGSDNISSSTAGDPDRNDLSDAEAGDADSDSTSSSEFFQQSEVSITSGEAQDDGFYASAGEESSGPADTAAAETIPAAVGDSVVAMGQAISGPGAGSSAIEMSGLPGLSAAASPISGLTGSLGGSSPGSTALATVEDDDNDYDFSLSGLMESVGSIYTYFTFLNPLNYSLFTLAAAPFAAFAAGIIGVAAVFFPWALPGVLDFGRAADQVTIRFKPSLDEVVRQSMYKYGDWNDWKSKRRKRKK